MTVFAKNKKIGNEVLLAQIWEAVDDGRVGSVCNKSVRRDGLEMALRFFARGNFEKYSEAKNFFYHSTLGHTYNTGVSRYIRIK